MTVQTQSQVTHDLRLAARQGLLPARGSGWVAGFGNMLSKELGEWFHTRRWLLWLLIWLTIINGFLAYLLFGIPASVPAEGAIPPEAEAMLFYFSIVMMAGGIGAVIMAQDEIIQEKQSGTAAWILSKPATRQSFILTKLVSNITGVLIFIVAVPGLVALGEIFLATNQLPMAPFLAGAGVVLLALVFDLSLVILLGVLFQSRGPVLGIALGVILGGMLVVQYVPKIAYVLPVAMDKIALLVTQGTPLPAMMVSELIATPVLSILFILIALWRFQHIEL